MLVRGRAGCETGSAVRSVRSPRASAPLSMLFVPLVSGDEVRGRISLQNLDRTNAFTESDVRLLTTLAGSLSVALENARLVHETRQRNAELALINSVQEALAGELELQAIYDVVGDKIQEIFDAQVVDIAIFDFAAGLMRFPYAIERGVRFPDEPRPLERSLTTKQMLETKAAVRGRTTWMPWFAERGAEQSVCARASPRDRCCSLRWAPATRSAAVISLQNLDRTNAFTENDVRAADDARGQPQRGARERAAGARDAAAERRARADQQRAGRDRRRARPAGDLRRRRRQDPGDLRRAGRRHRDARRGDRAAALPVHHRARRALAGRADRRLRGFRSTCSRRASRC